MYLIKLYLKHLLSITKLIVIQYILKVISVSVAGKEKKERRKIWINIKKYMFIV